MLVPSILPAKRPRSDGDGLPNKRMKTTHNATNVIDGNPSMIGGINDSRVESLASH